MALNGMFCAKNARFGALKIALFPSKRDKAGVFARALDKRVLFDPHFSHYSTDPGRRPIPIREVIL